jgi:predicted nucleotidyltransferase
MITTEQLNRCVEVAIRHGSNRLVLFGSAAETPALARDIDLICSGVKGLDLLRMAAEMENETGVQVDAVQGDDTSGFVRMNSLRGKLLYENP